MKPAQELSPNLLNSLEHLGELRPESRRDLLRKGALRACKAGEYLFQQNRNSATTYYLLEGALQLLSPDGAAIELIEADTPAALHALSPKRQQSCQALCATDVRCLALDAKLLDVMLIWDQNRALEVSEINTASANASGDWMTRLLQTPAFQYVPATNLQAIFMRMQKAHASAGQVIIKQGDTGDYFYVLIDGRCMVTREQVGQKPLRLSELTPGSSFGEDALISDAPRNATVTATVPSVVMRLAKGDFQKLLTEPLIRRVSMEEAKAMAECGKGHFLDVRLHSEVADNALPASLNVPMYTLRMRLNRLDRRTSYICVCNTGRQSSVAAFVLLQNGFEAVTLDRGLQEYR